MSVSFFLFPCSKGQAVRAYLDTIQITLGKIREAGDIAMVHLRDWRSDLVKFIGLLGEQSAEILPYFSNCTLLGWAYQQRYIEG